MARSIYFHNLTNRFKTYTFWDGPPYNRITFYDDQDWWMDFTSPFYTVCLWIPLTASTSDIPERDSGYCVLEGGSLIYNEVSSLKLVYRADWPTADPIKIKQSNWTAKSFNMTSYNTFCTDIATHLNRAPTTWTTINALVFYNLRILDLTASGGDGTYPSDDYVSGFWAYWGNDPAAPKVITI